MEASISASSARSHGLSTGMRPGESTTTVDVLVLLASAGSTASLATVAMLMALPGLLCAITLMTMGAAAATPSDGMVHVTTPAACAHDQPLPEALTNVAPAGRVSVTVAF